MCLELTFFLVDFIGLCCHLVVLGDQGIGDSNGLAFDLTFSTPASPGKQEALWKHASSGSETNIDNYRVISEL